MKTFFGLLTLGTLLSGSGCIIHEHHDGYWDDDHHWHEHHHEHYEHEHWEH